MTILKEVDIPKQVVSNVQTCGPQLTDTLQPPGKYTVLADVNTVDKEKISCLESTVVFSKQ